MNVIFYQKMFLRSISLLSLSVLTLINGGFSATAQIKLPLEINIDVQEKEAQSPGGGSNTNNERLCPNNDNSKQELISKTVPLYYLRQPTAIKGILDTFIKKDKTNLKNAIVQSQGNNTDLILYGCRSEIEKMERIIATLDIPLQGITMEMWGIQISSSNPEKLSKALIEINQEINKTQQLMKATYRELEKMAIAIEVDPTYKKILEQDLGYLTALQIYDELSMADILLRINAADNPDQNAEEMVIKMGKLFAEPQYKDYINYLYQRQQVPFERFFQGIGLEKNCPVGKNQPFVQNCPWKDQGEINGKTLVEFQAIRGKQALLRFALDYGYSIQKPNEFDGQRLQETSEAVNARIRLLANAINQDVADLFIEPTLEKIQAIVRRHNDVELRSCTYPKTDW